MSNKRKYHVAASPLTGTIFAGTVLKSGIWSTDKQDVTIAALVAVAEHGLQFGKPIVIRTEDGQPLFRITVERIEEQP